LRCAPAGLRGGRGRPPRRRREGPVDQELLDQRAAAAGAAPGTALDVLTLLDGLDEEDRALLILKYAEGCSHEELADMFDLSISACKMRISRARERLQRKERP
jgi:DNA-directed RNA polymerase specialized sigma24 family protein